MINSLGNMDFVVVVVLIKVKNFFFELFGVEFFVFGLLNKVF